MFSKIFCGSKKTFLILAILFLNLLFISPVLAQAPNGNYVPLVSIPGIDPNAGILTYLSGLYNFLISIVGILAMAVIIYGGMRYLTSAGNPSSVEEAKDAITSAVIGLILALTSWVILSTINPDILVLKSVGVGGSGTGYKFIKFDNTCVANSTGSGIASNPCLCADRAEVYSTSPIGPKVVATSVSPCSTNISTATSTINITFSEALDPASVSTGTIKTYFPGSPSVKVELASSTVVTLTIGAPYLAANSPQEIIVTIGVKSAKGVAMNASSCSAAAGSSPEATTAYDLRFTTGGSFSGGADCVSCSFGSSNPCQSICSDSSLASDSEYHCLKAVMVALVTKDLPYEVWGQKSRAYDTPENPLTIPDNTWIAWNGLNYSATYPTYPGLATPIQYCFDGLPSPSTSNGVCDLATEGGSSNARAVGNILYSDFVGKSNCTTITNPASIQCRFNYIIQDSSGSVSSSTNLYVRILKP